MKRQRYTLTLIFLSLYLNLYAQDYFNETLTKVKQATPHEAAYILSGYQQFLPTFHATYFHLGNIYYDLIPTEHPIRDYYELKQCLYRTKLYYGNCLYYAKDQTLKPAYYEGLPYAGKRPEYTELQQYIQKRIALVDKTSQLSQELFDSYNQLVNRYNNCRILFSAFAETYMREKTAHLLLSEHDRAKLLLLQTQADSLQYDIQRLQNALKNFPVKDYQPHFRFESINLYRLDGLTSTNILQNDVVLWDYSTWTKDFLSIQNNTYRTYFDAIDKEHTTLQQAITHPTDKIRINNILLNRINRIDYQSLMIDYIGLEQQTALIASIAQDQHFMKCNPTDEYIEQSIELVYKQHKAYTQLQTYRQQLQEHISPQSLNHHAELWTKWQLNNIDSLLAQGQYYTHLAQQYIDHTAHAFAANIKPVTLSVTSYTNDISGETFGISNMHFTIEDSVVAILPVDTNYMIVLPRHTILSTLSGEMMSKTPIATEKPVFTAFKYSSHVIALVNESQVFFFDTESQHK